MSFFGRLISYLGFAVVVVVTFASFRHAGYIALAAKFILCFNILVVLTGYIRAYGSPSEAEIESALSAHHDTDGCLGS